MKAAIVILLAAILLLAPIALNTASAEAPDAVTIVLMTDPSFVWDSNKACTEGPQNAYVGYKVTNTGAAGTFTVTLSDDNATNFAPGGTPVETWTRTLTLAAGQVDYVYFYVKYPCAQGPTATANFTATVRDAGNVVVGSVTSPMAVYSTISASAGGQIVSTSSTNPAGQFVFTVQYAFGNVQVNPQPDQFNLQPAGNDDFAAGCLRLVDTLITQSTITAIPAGTQNDLYFTTNVAQGGNHTVTVEYTFDPTGVPGCGGATRLFPYASQHSGSENRKYTGNYGQIILAADIALFQATATGSNVLVEWQTVSELDNLGFNLYRSDTAGGAMVQINPTLIPSASGGSSTGASYEWLDENVADGLYDYWLESVDVHGVRELSGPATVRVGVPTAVTLGSIEVQRTSPMLPFALAGMAGTLGALAVWRRRR